MAQSSSLLAYKVIRKAITNENLIADDRIQASIKITSETRSSLNSLVECNWALNLQNSNAKEITLGQVSDGDVISLRLEGLVNENGVFIGNSWSDLTKYQQNLFNPPKQIYLSDTSEVFDQDSKDLKYTNLQKIPWILDKLKKFSDHYNNFEYVFLHHHKIEIPLKADGSILDNEIALEIDRLKLIIDDEHHESAKKNLFKIVVCEMLADTKKEQRFKKLIQEFDTFVKRFELAFYAYVSDYSFDKIRMEFEEKRTEYIKKVNDAFQEVTSKLIILPAPLWLAFSQSGKVRPEGVLDLIQLYKNWTIIILTVVLSILLFLMILGQLNALESIKTEYTNLFDRLKSKYPEVKLDHKDELKGLSDRYCIVHFQLVVSQIVNVMLGVFSVVVVYQAF